MKQEIKPGAVVPFMFAMGGNQYTQTEMVVVAFDSQRGIRLEGENESICCLDIQDPDADFMVVCGCIQYGTKHFVETWKTDNYEKVEKNCPL